MLRNFFLPHNDIRRTKSSHLQTISLDSGISSATFQPFLPSSTSKSTQQTHKSYLVINKLPPAPSPPLNPSTPNSALCPPLHWHRYQTETFHIIKGQAKFHWDRIDDLHAQIVTQDEIIVVSKGKWHTFRNASFTDELVVEFVLDPPAAGTSLKGYGDGGGGDEMFFRNTWMYRDDCVRAGIQRNYLQVLVFNYYGGVVIALPLFGNGLVARWVGVLMNFWGGRVVGEMVCGFKRSYDEYFLDEGEGVSQLKGGKEE